MRSSSTPRTRPCRRSRFLTRWDNPHRSRSCRSDAVPDFPPSTARQGLLHGDPRQPAHAGRGQPSRNPRHAAARAQSGPVDARSPAWTTSSSWSGPRKPSSSRRPASSDPAGEDAIVSGQAPAVVIGLDCITGLQTARILAARQVPVVALAGNLRHFACRTNVCERILQSDLASERLIERLERSAGARSRVGAATAGRAVPCTDASVLLLSRPGPLHPWIRDARRARRRRAADDKTRFYDTPAHESPDPEPFLLGSRRDAKGAVRDLRFCGDQAAGEDGGMGGADIGQGVQVADADELLGSTGGALGGDADRAGVIAWRRLPVLLQLLLRRESRPLGASSQKAAAVAALHRNSCLGEECRNARSWHRPYAVRRRGVSRARVRRDEVGSAHAASRRHEPNVGRPTGRSRSPREAASSCCTRLYCDSPACPCPSSASSVSRHQGLEWERPAVVVLYARRGERVARLGSILRGPKTHRRLLALRPTAVRGRALQAGDKRCAGRDGDGTKRRTRVSAEEDVPPPTPVRAPMRSGLGFLHDHRCGTVGVSCSCAERRPGARCCADPIRRRPEHRLDGGGLLPAVGALAVAGQPLLRTRRCRTPTRLAVRARSGTCTTGGPPSSGPRRRWTW